MLRGILRRGKFDIYVLVAAATHGFTMVSFSDAVSRRNTFVGGKCAPPSVLLVSCTVVSGQKRHELFLIIEIGVLLFDLLF